MTALAPNCPPQRPATCSHLKRKSPTRCTTPPGSLHSPRSSLDERQAARRVQAGAGALEGSTATPPARAEAEATRVAALEAQVAELHLEAQRLNKIAGQEAAATQVYKQLAALDDEALELRLASARLPTPADVAAHAADGYADYCHLPPCPPSWRDVAAATPASSGSRNSSSSGLQPVAEDQLRQRALGAVLGGALGDAAACGVQWVYSEGELGRLAAGRPLGLEFHDPPACPFFDYPVGSPSPYGEQALVLLRSLVNAGGLDCCRYAAEIYAYHGPGYAGYRDRSTKSFLRRYSSGCLPPATGSPDDQANCFARLPPLVGLYAGAGRATLLGAVERMVRVTQDDDVAVAYGCAAALVLEGVLLGGSVTSALASTVDWLQQQGQQQEQQQELNGAGVAHRVPAALWSEVAARLLQAAALAPLPPLDAALVLGKNCHLPNSLQTPLQVLLHVELRQRQQASSSNGNGSDEAGAGSVSQPAAQAAQAQGFQVAVQAGTSADNGEFCLPCSMGSGTACALPGKSSAAEAGRSLLDQGSQQGQRQWPARLPAQAYIDAVRQAIRPGGCCASRAGFAGALAGALVGAEQLPASWIAKMQGYHDVAHSAKKLLQLRD